MNRSSSSLLSVAIDLRCLQNSSPPNSAIARHVTALLSTAPADQFELIGIVDDRLQPLQPEIIGLLTGIVPNAYAAHKRLRASGQPAAFISAAPMTHDATYTARLVNAPGILHAALVYDLIPLAMPDRYIKTAAAGIAYATNLAWLAPADLFAATSKATADDLVRLLEANPARVCVTGMPMGPHASPPRALNQRQTILMVANPDTREGAETVILAHARSTKLQQARVLLVIAGASNGDSTRFAELTVQNGGNPSLLQVSAATADTALAPLYEPARIVVCPVTAAGFALSALDGISAGAIVLATDIPAHAELVPDPANRFPAGDADALKRLLDTWWDRAPHAHALLARQVAVANLYSPQAVGERFWPRLRNAVHQMPATPAIATGRRATVAFMTPLPPDSSGVADYTQRTCIEMAEFANVHCFTPTQRPKRIAGVKSIQPLSALPALLPTYDAVVGVAGNSRFHTKIVEHVLEYGGAIIAHDARMLGFYRVLLGLDRAMQVASKELHRPVSKTELDEWMGDERKLKALFLGELARAASPLIVHSPVTASTIKERYGITPEYLPFSIYRQWTDTQLTPRARKAARDRLGLQADEVVLVTFGALAADKAPDTCIRALSTLRNWKVPARLFFVGNAASLDDKGEALRTLAQSLNVASYVELSRTHVAEARYKDFLVAADVGIQLRTYGLGGLSGAVLDCAAAGLPTVVNQSLLDTVQPPSYIQAIPDTLSPAMLAGTIVEIIDELDDRAVIEAERQTFCTSRGMRSYARGLCTALGITAA